MTARWRREWGSWGMALRVGGTIIAPQGPRHRNIRGGRQGGRERGRFAQAASIRQVQSRNGAWCSWRPVGLAPRGAPPGGTPDPRAIVPATWNLLTRNVRSMWKRSGRRARHRCCSAVRTAAPRSTPGRRPHDPHLDPGQTTPLAWSAHPEPPRPRRPGRRPHRGQTSMRKRESIGKRGRPMNRALRPSSYTPMRRAIHLQPVRPLPNDDTFPPPLPSFAIPSSASSAPSTRCTSPPWPGSAPIPRAKPPSRATSPNIGPGAPPQGSSRPPSPGAWTAPWTDKPIAPKAITARRFRYRVRSWVCVGAVRPPRRREQ